MAPVRGRKIAVYHRSWSYLVARYGLQVVGEVEPKPGLPPTAGHLKRLADAMLAGGVKVLVSEPWYSESQVAGLLKRTGARLVRLPTTSGLTPETADYLDYLDHLLRTLSGALQGTESGS